MTSVRQRLTSGFTLLQGLNHSLPYPLMWNRVMNYPLSYYLLLWIPLAIIYITLILFSLILTAVFPSLHLIQSKHNSVNLISSPSISLIQDMIILWSIVCFHFLWFSTLEFNIKSTFIPSCSFLMAKLIRVFYFPHPIFSLKSSLLFIYSNILLDFFFFFLQGWVIITTPFSLSLSQNLLYYFGDDATTKLFVTCTWNVW